MPDQAKDILCIDEQKGKLVNTQPWKRTLSYFHKIVDMYKLLFVKETLANLCNL